MSVCTFIRSGLDGQTSFLPPLTWAVRSSVELILVGIVFTTVCLFVSFSVQMLYFLVFESSCWTASVNDQVEF